MYLQLPKESDLPLSVKNYKELCSILGVPATGGKAKTITLSKIEHNLELVRSGNSFTILSLKKEFYEKMPRKTRADNIWVTPVSSILLDYLARHVRPGKVSFVYMTMPELSELVGMVNSNYIESSLATHGGRHSSVFKAETRLLTKNALSRAFENLASRKVLDIVNTYVYIDETTMEYKEFSKADIVRITETYGQAFIKFGIETEVEIYSKPVSVVSEFYEYINTLLSDRFSINYHLKAKRFGFTEALLDRAIEFRLEASEILKTKRETNNKVQAKLLDRLETLTPSLTFSSKKLPQELAKEQFIEGFKELIDIFIKLE